MAFLYQAMTKIDNLLIANDPTTPTPGLWYYVTSDSLATMMTAGYFNAASYLVTGSIIVAICANGIQTLQVTGNTAAVLPGVVTVTNLATLARGQATTITANDTIVTGLSGPLLGAVATFNDDLVVGAAYVTGNIGNQSGAPAAGSFLLKSWEPTSSSNPTPIAATTFGKKVNWIAWQ